MFILFACRVAEVVIVNCVDLGEGFPTNWRRYSWVGEGTAQRFGLLPLIIYVHAYQQKGLVHRSVGVHLSWKRRCHPRVSHICIRYSIWKVRLLSEHSYSVFWLQRTPTGGSSKYMYGKHVERQMLHRRSRMFKLMTHIDCERVQVVSVVGQLTAQVEVAARLAAWLL